MTPSVTGIEVEIGGHEMAQRIKVFAAKPDDLSSGLRSYMVE